MDYSGKGKRYADKAERTSRTAHKTRKIWEEIGPFPGGGPAGSTALRQTGAPGTGTVEILAVQGGTVLRTKRSASYGSCMELLLADGTAAVYAHLQYIYVRPGEAVEAGQLLGTAGQSGRATGAHLHFELYRQGKACDPADALGLSHEAS